MAMRRGWYACVGVGASLVMFAAVSASAALATTTNLEWDPPAYDFGSVPYMSGPSEPHTFTVTNTGETQLVPKHWRSAWVGYWPEGGSPFWDPSPSTCPALEPGESCSIELVFDPAHPGIWRGWQEVRSDIEGEPWVDVELTGYGTGPWVPVTPDHLAFGSVAVGMTTTPQIITLESQDREKLRIDAISSTPAGGGLQSSTPFQVVGGSCHEGESLAPGKTCTIEVVMAPTVSGLFQSKLKITDTAPDSPQSIDIEGTATAVASPFPPSAITPPARLKHACPKGKRKVVKKGRRICVKTRRHRHHSAHAAR
jgi:centrosomal CEP192-like protein